jgi:hypothetical protein
MSWDSGPLYGDKQKQNEKCHIVQNIAWCRTSDVGEDGMTECWGMDEYLRS